LWSKHVCWHRLSFARHPAEADTAARVSPVVLAGTSAFAEVAQEPMHPNDGDEPGTTDDAVKGKAKSKEESTKDKGTAKSKKGSKKDKKGPTKDKKTDRKGAEKGGQKRKSKRQMAESSKKKACTEAFGALVVHH
jgi:hypothetical protein